MEKVLQNKHPFNSPFDPELEEHEDYDDLRSEKHLDTETSAIQ